MGFEYALVHLKYTIPPAIALTLLYRPLLTRLDIYKILFLVTVAVLSTTPWDSYLIRNRIWSYPPNVIVGLTLLDIPLEELFFFAIQTYNTSLLYLLLSKPTFHPAYLRAERRRDNPQGATNEGWRFYRLGGQLALVACIRGGFSLFKDGGEGTYLGLISVWACPFLLFLWTIAYQFIIALPASNTILPIALPTLYLWIVDTLALKRGTWVIESGTKLGFHLWPGLEIEEAVFFLVTNMLIVFGLVAFDNTLATLNAFPDVFPHVPALPSPVLLTKALLHPVSLYDDDRIAGLTEAVARLRRKSRSFFLASGAFQGRLRIDLIILYSFCRVADDLVDDAATPAEARDWIGKLTNFLNLSYLEASKRPEVVDYVTAEFPPHVRRALLQLPTGYLSKGPLYDLLKGFEMDLTFAENRSESEMSHYPIRNESDLEVYGARVAGTVAELCLELVFHHYGAASSEAKQRFISAGGRMGVALQYVNISRDVEVDARINRVYIPVTWLEEEGLTPQAVIRNPKGTEIEKLRSRLLDQAFSIYEGSRDAINELPVEARGPMRVAVESYMEIGRVLRQKGYQVNAGRATVPKGRRIRVAWHALSK